MSQEYCTNCKAPVSAEDNACPFCNHTKLEINGGKRTSNWVIAILVLITFGSLTPLVLELFKVNVPAGHIGVVENHRGVQQILPEGRHVINPLMYKVDVVEIVEVPPGYIGVRLNR